MPIDGLGSRPLTGIKLGLITETMGEGVDADVLSAVRAAVSHLESLGASVQEVCHMNQYLSYQPSW